MLEEIFTVLRLPVSGEVTILEGKGIHYFSAFKKSNGDSALILKFLMMELILVNNKKITEQQLNDMHLRDIAYLSTVLGTMMSDEFKNGI